MAGAAKLVACSDAVVCDQTSSESRCGIADAEGIMSAASNGEVCSASAYAIAPTTGASQSVDAADPRIRADDGSSGKLSSKLLLVVTLRALGRRLVWALHESRYRRAAIVLRECAHVLPPRSCGDKPPSADWGRR